MGFLLLQLANFTYAAGQVHVQAVGGALPQ